jgi:hypothetical protein
MASFAFVLKLNIVDGSMLLWTDYIIKEMFVANLRHFPRCFVETSETSEKYYCEIWSRQVFSQAGLL